MRTRSWVVERARRPPRRAPRACTYGWLSVRSCVHGLLRSNYVQCAAEGSVGISRCCWHCRRLSCEPRRLASHSLNGIVRTPTLLSQHGTTRCWPGPTHSHLQALSLNLRPANALLSAVPRPSPNWRRAAPALTERNPQVCPRPAQLATPEMGVGSQTVVSDIDGDQRLAGYGMRRSASCAAC